MTRVVVLLVVLIVVEWSGSREPVCSICHLTRSTKEDGNFHVVLSSAMEEVILRASLRSIIGIRGLCVLGFRLERLRSTNLNCG